MLQKCSVGALCRTSHVLHRTRRGTAAADACSRYICYSLSV
jgi:hypothetical protein